MATKSKEKPKSKKPFHIPRSELNLPEYIEERNARSPKVLLERLLAHTVYAFWFRAYLILQVLAVVVGYGQVMLCIGLLWAMLVNTSKRQPGEKSAYSLFNEGIEGIAGSTDMEALERELRTRGT